MPSHLHITSLTVTPRLYSVSFNVADPLGVIKKGPLTIEYDQDVPQSPFFAISACLSTLLPPLAKEYSTIEVDASLNLPLEFTAYWEGLLTADELGVFRIDWQHRDGRPTLEVPQLVPHSPRSALYFGGGVESTYGLSVLHEQNPLLISILGPGWMNNNEESYSLKRDLEDRLVKEHKVELTRIRSNAFDLVNRDDLYRNRYLTGMLFYWCALPLCHQHGIGLLFKGSELEEALNFKDYDLSLSPMFQQRISFPGQTVVMSAFNSCTKVKMFEHLSHTPFLEFVYSCYFNSGQRWCGRCTKCYRISEFCHRIGIPRSRIGMPEGFIGIRETGYLTRHFWVHMDLFYGRPWKREIQHAIIYYYRKARSRVGRIVRKLLGGQRA